MYSTLTLAKNSKLTGKIVGTHQLLDQSARKALGKLLPRGKYFPSSKEILHFEGMRGPDGLKRKSPNLDDPTHMFADDQGASLLQQIDDHYYNLVQALQSANSTRAAFEAAWLAHKVTDAITPAHHYPLSQAKDELMTKKELVKVFGEPIKGLVRGRNPLETMRNNWLYWGVGGYLTKHIAYEYGVALLATAMPRRRLQPRITPDDLQPLTPRQLVHAAIARLNPEHIYATFRAQGWTTDLAFSTRDLLLPEITKTITLIWYAAAREAYHFRAKPAKPAKSPKPAKPAKAAKPAKSPKPAKPAKPAKSTPSANPKTPTQSHAR